MIDALKRLFDQAVSEVADGGDRSDHGRRLAVATLLVEVLRADGRADLPQRQAVSHALNEAFELEPEEVSELVSLAEDRADEATSLFEFTHEINNSFEHAEKVRIVEMLWRVAYADGELEKHEAHLMRRIADLLHLRHKEYIAAKLRAAPR